MSRRHFQPAWRSGTIVGARIALALALGSVFGCVSKPIPGFDSPAPSKRIDAIVDASALEDDESFVKLVEKLRSFDTVERMFAIRSLEIRTGETLGYHHGDPEWERLEAYGRWIEYLQAHGIETDLLIQADSGPIMDDGDDTENQPMEHDGVQD